MSDSQTTLRWALGAAVLGLMLVSAPQAKAATGCDPGWEKSGLLCYPKCKAGYKGVGPVCWQYCGPGYHDDGATCRRNAKIISANNGACPWYDKCGVGLYYWKHKRRCSSCPAGYINDGCTCRINVHIYGKKSYGRGVGKPPSKQIAPSLGRWGPVPGGLKQVSVGSEKHVWGVNQAGQIWRWTGSTWQEISGRLTNVSVGADGAVWGVNGAGQIWRRDGDNWKLMPGRLVQISVGSKEHVWGVNQAGQVWRWTGSEWQLIPGKLASVSVGADGAVWGLSRAGAISRFEFYSWKSVAGHLSQISVGATSRVWGVTRDHQVFRLALNTKQSCTRVRGLRRLRCTTRVAGPEWKKAGGGLKWVSVAQDGTLWGVNGANMILRSKLTPQEIPSGQLPVNLYVRDCRGVRLEGLTLRAHCTYGDRRQRVKEASLAGPCFGKVANFHGNLSCVLPHAPGTPAGGYRDSCSGARMDASKLVAMCRTSDGRWVNASIDPKECGARPIENQDGRLACGYVRRPVRW